MSNLIDRQAAIDEVKDLLDSMLETDTIGFYEIEHILFEVPSEDVQPVVHGEWIPVTAIYKFKEDQFPQTERVWVDATEPDEIDAVKCSICGEVFDFADARNWCTQCGAKMDKRKGADNEVN